MKTVLHIEGMSCAHCVAHVKEGLEEVRGVNSALVSLADKSATVEHEESVLLSHLEAAVADAGYTVV